MMMTTTMTEKTTPCVHSLCYAKGMYVCILLQNYMNKKRIEIDHRSSFEKCKGKESISAALLAKLVWIYYYTLYCV